METLEAIRNRASLKTRLAPREVEQEKIDTILEAARLAPSARNRQPWRFIVVKDRETIRALVETAFSASNAPVGEAPVIIIACANPSDAIVVGDREYYLFDVGLAVQNMLLAATDLGLVSHPMTGVNEDELKRILGVPDEVRFVVATPLSYPAAGSYQEAAAERLGERTRKELTELVYLNAWGKPLY